MLQSLLTAPTAAPCLLSDDRVERGGGGGCCTFDDVAVAPAIGWIALVASTVVEAVPSHRTTSTTTDSGRQVTSQLRIENAYDGVPHETQAPIPPGGRYTHRLTLPDAGHYWYHPHIREDYAQEMGLYGNIIVEPADPAYWPAADRDVFVTLDDILIEDGRVASFDPHGPTFAAMGRFGNVLLIAGETRQHLEVARGEVVRLHLTNTANTRVFRVAVPNARMKLVGGRRRPVRARGVGRRRGRRTVGARDRRRAVRCRGRRHGTARDSRARVPVGARQRRGCR